MSPQNDETRNVEKIIALLFTMVGGIFWIVTMFSGSRGLTIAGNSSLGAFTFTGGALVPLIFTVIVLLLGYYKELWAAVILGLGAIFTLAWGVIAAWPGGVWFIMGIFFILPTIIASILFYLAHGKSQKVETAAPASAGGQAA